MLQCQYDTEVLYVEVKSDVDEEIVIFNDRCYNRFQKKRYLFIAKINYYVIAFFLFKLLNLSCDAESRVI